ncbi:MAG TPA: hypothetical protein VGI82_04885 [Chitinophagaceae bacterium]
MLKLGELKAGDIIKVNDDGIEREGTVVEISHEEHQALVDNGIQEFWYAPEEMQTIPVDEQQLLKLGFQKQELGEEGIKYMKGAFRLVTPREGDFSNIEMWYREDRRHFNHPLGVHQLQNLHLQMTKVPLEMPA